MNEPTASQSPNEWGALQLDTRPLGWNVSTLFLAADCTNCSCAGLSTHAVFSDKAKPGGPGWRAVLGGLIMLSGKLKVTLQQTDHCWTCMCYVFAVQKPSMTDRTASLLTGYTRNTPLNWLSSLWGAGGDKKGNGWREHWGGTEGSVQYTWYKHDIVPSLIFIATCSMSGLSRAVSDVKYRLLSTSLTLPFIRLLLSLFSFPLPDHCCVCGRVFCGAEQRAACIAYLALCTSVLDL